MNEQLKKKFIAVHCFHAQATIGSVTIFVFFKFVRQKEQLKGRLKPLKYVCLPAVASSSIVNKKSFLFVCFSQQFSARKKGY